jgi:CheY-like chemotaxis protein
MTLMLVDDDQDDIELFSEALREIDSSIVLVTAHNGEDALKILESDFFEKPDRVFLDLNMPVMNGLDCLRAIKARLKVPVPVTIYTTSQNPIDYSRCIELGADFLSKPHNFSTLRSVLRQKLRIN